MCMYSASNLKSTFLRILVTVAYSIIISEVCMIDVYFFCDIKH